MGNRASYLLIEDGQSHIYFSRWGALSIPAVLLSGPDATMAYIRALTPYESLLDDTWGEGAILLDVDTRELRFFGGLEVDRTPYLQRALLRALRLLWPTWTVEWTLFGMADLALRLNRDVGEVLTAYEDPQLYAPRMSEQSLEALPACNNACSVVTVKWSASEAFDYPLNAHQMNALSLGPRLLDLLKNMQPLALPREDAFNFPFFDGVYLDATTQALWMTGDDPRELPVVGQMWPGWSVNAHTRDIVWQVAMSGRDPSAIMVPEERTIEELIADLMSVSTTNPGELYAAMSGYAQSQSSEPQRITVGEGFFSADAPPMSKDEQRETLLRLLRATSTHGDSATSEK